MRWEPIGGGLVQIQFGSWEATEAEFWIWEVVVYKTSIWRRDVTKDYIYIYIYMFLSLRAARRHTNTHARARALVEEEGEREFLAEVFVYLLLFV